MIGRRTSHLRSKLLSCGLLILATGDAHAREAGIYRTCSFTAFVTETDPAGLNVRAGPSSRHTVIGTLPPVYLSQDEPPVSAMVEVQVDASQSGWFRIRDARDNVLIVDTPRSMYRGRGWVSGRSLTIKSQAKAARDVANRRGGPIKIAGTDFDAGNFVSTSHIADCVGGWVLTMNEKYKFRGWLNRICGIQETSCGSD